MRSTHGDLGENCHPSKTVCLCTNSINTCSGHIPILDTRGKVFALIIKRSKGWEEQDRLVSAAMRQLDNDLKGLGCKPNRRGDFAAYAKGFTLGGGPVVSQGSLATIHVTYEIIRFLGPSHAQPKNVRRLSASSKIAR